MYPVPARVLDNDGWRPRTGYADEYERLMMNWLREQLGDLYLPPVPFFLVSAAIIFVGLTWVPLALVARARVTPNAQPPVHLFQDMDEQPKYQAQGTSLLFRDRRAMRPPVPGTVARGHLQEDDHFYRGFRLVNEGGEQVAEYFAGMPAGVTVDDRFILRGQVQFNVYCFPCHGMTGEGNGPIHQRAQRLQQSGNANVNLGTTWTQPSNLLIQAEDGSLTYGPADYPDGKLFNVITHGIRNMPAYEDQIEPRDRWAIVAYIRALQLTRTQQLQGAAAGPQAAR